MEQIYQMTEKEFRQKKERLQTAQDALDSILTDMKAARELGDLRENSEYDAARDRYRETQNEISQLTVELENCEIIHDDNSPVIKIGSRIAVTMIDEHKQPIGDSRKFVVSQHGDTIISKTIGANSPLGKVILGKSSGYFDIVCNGKKHYRVEKLLDA